VRCDIDLFEVFRQRALASTYVSMPVTALDAAKTLFLKNLDKLKGDDLYEFLDWAQEVIDESQYGMQLHATENYSSKFQWLQSRSMCVTPSGLLTRSTGSKEHAHGGGSHSSKALKTLEKYAMVRINTVVPAL
jgi:hypothetical protein